MAGTHDRTAHVDTNVNDNYYQNYNDNYIDNSDEGKLTLECLPCEILLCIFEQLKAEQVCFVSQTCRRFRGLTSKESLWRKLCKKTFGLDRNDDTVQDFLHAKRKDKGKRGKDSASSLSHTRSLEAHDGINVCSWKLRYMKCHDAITKHASETLWFKGVATDGGCDGTERYTASTRAVDNRHERLDYSTERVIAYSSSSDDMIHQRTNLSLSDSSTSAAVEEEVYYTSRYWVDNMFTPTHWDSYCSLASYNVHCFAYLQGDPARVDKSILEFRSYIISRTRSSALAMFGPTLEIHRWSTAELELFITELWNAFLEGHEIGLMLFEGLTHDQMSNEVRRVRDLVEMIENSKEGPTASQIHALNGDMSILEMKHIKLPVESCYLRTNDVENRQEGVTSRDVHLLKEKVLVSEMGLIDSVNISRIGQFSCPVSAGAVLIGCASTASECLVESLTNAAKSGVCAILKDMTSLSQVVEASKAGRLPTIIAIKHNSAGQFIEFLPSTSDNRQTGQIDLRPVAWFKFISKIEAKAAASAQGLRIGTGQNLFGTRSETERWDQMEVNLEHYHAGNVMCAKLINHENLMDEWDDTHETPNIDINSIWLKGVKFR